MRAPKPYGTIGIQGVNFYKRQKKYSARISINGNRKNLGYYSNPFDAWLAVADVSKNELGEFSYLQDVEEVRRLSDIEILRRKNILEGA
jgi:hypothetical protein